MRVKPPIMQAPGGWQVMDGDYRPTFPTYRLADAEAERRFLQCQFPGCLNERAGTNKARYCAEHANGVWIDCTQCGKRRRHQARGLCITCHRKRRPAGREEPLKKILVEEWPFMRDALGDSQAITRLAQVYSTTEWLVLDELHAAGVREKEVATS